MNAPAKTRARSKQGPVHFRVARVTVNDTGEITGALVPLTRWDTRTMRERKYHVGSELRAELKKARNVQFYRLGHVLGAFLADHVPGFEGLTQHDALKKLQTESGIGVVEESFDLGELGQVKRRVAESLNFQDMDEGRWAELWSGSDGEGGWVGWLRANKLGGLDQVTREEFELMIEKPGLA